MKCLFLQRTFEPTEWVYMLIGFSFLSLLVIIPVSAWKIFVKAGREGWEALIPFYNVFVGLKIIGKPVWWFLVIFIPYVNMIFIIWSLNMLSKSFGKTEWFTTGLYFLGFIFFPILAFGDAIYQGPYGNAVAFRAYQMELQPMFEFEETAKEPGYQ